MSSFLCIGGLIAFAAAIFGAPENIHHPGYAFAAGVVLVLLGIPTMIWEHVHEHKHEREHA